MSRWDAHPWWIQCQVHMVEIWNWNLAGRFPCAHFFTTSILYLESRPALSLHHSSGIRKAGDGTRCSDMASHAAVSIMNHRWSRRFRRLNMLLQGAVLNFFSGWIIMLTFMVFSRLSSLGCHVTSPCQLDTTHTADSSQAAAGRTWCMSGVFRIQGVLFSPASSDSSGVCAAAEDPPWNTIYTLFYGVSHQTGVRFY